jgi:hypothetical protein
MCPLDPTGRRRMSLECKPSGILHPRGDHVFRFQYPLRYGPTPHPEYDAPQQPDTYAGTGSGPAGGATPVGSQAFGNVVNTRWVAVQRQLLSAWRGFWRAIGAGLLSNLEILVLATLLEQLGAFRWTREYWWGLAVLLGKDILFALKVAIWARLQQRKAHPVSGIPPLR